MSIPGRDGHAVVQSHELHLMLAPRHMHDVMSSAGVMCPLLWSFSCFCTLSRAEHSSEGKVCLQCGYSMDNIKVPVSAIFCAFVAFCKPCNIFSTRSTVYNMNIRISQTSTPIKVSSQHYHPRLSTLLAFASKLLRPNKLHLLSCILQFHKQSKTYAGEALRCSKTL